MIRLYLNAQGCQLWNLTVHIDLVSKCCIIFRVQARGECSFPLSFFSAA